MATVKGDPLAEFRTMQEQMSRLLDKSKNRAEDDEIEDGGWKPPVDIFEDESMLVVKMELPEMSEEDIHIEVGSDSLVIQGERQLEKAGENLSYHRIERHYGSFRRTFALPVAIDREGIEAVCNRGVLRVTLPKINPDAQDTLTLEE